MARLLYQGHGSYRITCADGTVIYIDPFAGKGYDAKADMILVTHEHRDHNCVARVPRSQDCAVIRACDALRDGQYSAFEIGGVKIRAVQAYNKNHEKNACVGFVLALDGVTLYAAGDTSETEDMRALLPGLMLDYAVLPGDGVFNMDIAEASRCARMIGAKHSIPVHLKPGGLFDEKTANRFDVPGRLIIRPGETVEL